MEFWVLSIIFIVIGILTVLYAHRFGRWWIGLNYKLHKIAPWFGASEENREEMEHNFYDKWPMRGYWLFWLWGIRILGALLAFAGMVVLVGVIVQSLT